jgi:hypothetical protein
MARGKSGSRSKAASPPDLGERLSVMLTESPGTKTSELASRMGIDQAEIRNALMDLETAGLVHRTGLTRGTRWFMGAGSSAPSDSELPPEPGERRGKKRGRAAAAPRGGARRGPKEARLDEVKATLGTVPDSDIAKQTGVSVRTIAAYRKRNSIAGYSGPRRARGPAKKAAAAIEAKPAVRARANGRSAGGAWRVDIRTGKEIAVRYVLATSVVDAAQSAMAGAAALGGEVVGIGWAGEAL